MWDGSVCLNEKCMYAKLSKNHGQGTGLRPIRKAFLWQSSQWFEPGVASLSPAGGEIS